MPSPKQPKHQNLSDIRKNAVKPNFILHLKKTHRKLLGFTRHLRDSGCPDQTSFFFMLLVFGPARSTQPTLILSQVDNKRKISPSNSKLPK